MTTTRRTDATGGRGTAGAGAPKGDAEGVLPAPRPTPPLPDGRHPVAWLHITAPRGRTPTATSRCACGRDRMAVGHAHVLDLIDDHTTHRADCPYTAPPEGRTVS
ncbi:hypothetical protein DY218_28570 [Streptomyces triticagri]|uniref:Uncharacterized protein n=1 Tax=Streptomyces triticagri TaxID=2293568 RepID=A0A372LX77_9ACTN|nr:hypothetical protein [Streptomyces triticagri]RFU83264.1 hypothetical protein DY218_28570 [Streptomyces triticagri]